MPEGSEPVEQLAAELAQLADAKAEAAGDEEATEEEEVQQEDGGETGEDTPDSTTVVGQLKDELMAEVKEIKEAASNCLPSSPRLLHPARSGLASQPP